ncbi:MAG: hypothetical protein ACI4VQ_01450 [Clostridia bacterium]
MNRKVSNSKIGEQSKGKYLGKKEQTRNAAKKAKTRFAAFLLTAGIGLGAVSTNIIGYMADKANHSQSTKEAITMAKSTRDYLDTLKGNPIMQDVITAENISKIEKFSSAVSTYKQLQYKQDKSLQEEQAYIDACRTICESKELVIDTYTNIIKGKVAKAYGITDPEEIENIEVRDYVDIGEKQDITHNLMVKLPNGTTINSNGNLFSSTNTMDKKLADAIIEARALLNERYSFENESLENLPMDRIISTFEEAKQFETGYKLSVKANGNLETVKIEQTKNQVTETEQEEEER